MAPSWHQRTLATSRVRLWMGMLLVGVVVAVVSWEYWESTTSLLRLVSRPRKQVDGGDKESRGTSLLSAGETLWSPNGAYALTVEDGGDVVLRQTKNDATRVWWTATGDNHTVDGRRAKMTRNGRGHDKLEVQALFEGQQDWTTLWHSDMVPSCHSDDDDDDDDKDKDSNPGQLTLSDSGRLRIANTCDLYMGGSQRQQSGRSLAVIVAGLYRTNPATCQTQMRAIIDQHGDFAQVDVFAYMLYDEGDVTERNRSRESIEAEVRACYGTHLARVEVHRDSDIEEDYPGGQEGMNNVCGTRLRRLNNQLKTIHQAGRMWRSWTIETGTLHDTVLRLRPDTGFNTDKDPPFWSLDDLATGHLVLVNPAREHYYYCARMNGQVGIGTSDQIAYGSPLAMSHWLSMHLDFREMVDMAVDRSRPAHRDFSGCEQLPTGPRPEHCGNPAVCSIECLVAWYLSSRGISFGVEWGWDQSLWR